MKENQIESCQQCMLVKTWHKNSFTGWFNQKNSWRGVLKIDVCCKMYADATCAVK